jgi:hypothetical protein
MNVQDLLPLSVAFVVITIVVSLGATVITDIQDTQYEFTSASQINESKLMINNTATSLAYNRWLSDPLVYNATTKLGSGNYTFDATAGTLTLKSILAYNNTNLTISYNYTVDVLNDDYNISAHGLEASTTFGDWLPTIALVVIIAVIIGVIIVYLANRFA